MKKSKGTGDKPRRRWDPDATRTAILDAAGTLLAKDGPEGLSVSQVAQLAGVNRGTAYQHFQTREQLLDATTGWVSEQLCQAVFGKSAAGKSTAGARKTRDGVERIDPKSVIEHMAQFAMQNPELGRAWLFRVLSSPQPAADPFWKQYRQRFEGFVGTDSAQPGIDIDVHTVLTIIGTFIWPVWARAHTRTAKERQQMAERYSNEVMRLSLHGNLRVEKYQELTTKALKKPEKMASKKTTEKTVVASGRRPRTK